MLCELANTAGLGIVGSRGLAVRMAQSLLVQGRGAARLRRSQDRRVLPAGGAGNRGNGPAGSPTCWTTTDPTGGSRARGTMPRRSFASLEPVFRRRQTERESAWGAAAPKLPHYLFLFADPGLLAGQPLAEELLRGGPALGATCILLGKSLQDLPGSGVADSGGARRGERIVSQGTAGRTARVRHGPALA